MIILIGIIIWSSVLSTSQDVLITSQYVLIKSHVPIFHLNSRQGPHHAQCRHGTLQVVTVNSKLHNAVRFYLGGLKKIPKHCPLPFHNLLSTTFGTYSVHCSLFWQNFFIGILKQKVVWILFLSFLYF